MASLRAFLSGLIDYAGLFPPAQLDMQSAVRNYAEYRAGTDRDLLGRFVVPASRLEEFAGVAHGMLDRGTGSVPWNLSVLADGDLLAARKAMLEFTSSHMSSSEGGHAMADAVEIRAVNPQQIASAADAFPQPLQLFFEISPASGYERMLEVAASCRAAAKIRTGGVTHDAFPSSGAVLSFVAACDELGLPFKATAGLHHALCGTYPLTYESGSDCGAMFGYLNLLLSAAFIRKGIEAAGARAILEEVSIDAFSFRNGSVSWKGNDLSRDDLRMTRSQLFLSFGSCSFREPVDEAKALGLI